MFGGGRRRRHFGRWILLGVLAIIVAWAAFVAVRLLSAAHQLQNGVRAAGTLRSQLHSNDLQNSPAGPILAAAAADFTAAHQTIDSGWLAPLRVVPYVGRQVRALDDLSGAAATVTHSGHQALIQVQAALSKPHGTPPERQTAIAALARTLTGLDRTVNQVDLGPSKSLWPSIAKRRNTFASDLDQLRGGLDKGAGAAQAVADLLGNHRTYLVLTANNAEMRAGQGMYLQAGTVTSSGGRLSLGSFGATANLVTSKPSVRVGGDLAARWGSLGLGNDYRKLGFSPQYPLNAPVAAAMWKAQTGRRVDGVLTVDVPALRDVLAAIGPVQAGGLTVSAGNVEQTLFVTQYVGDTSNAANDARREALGVLAAAVFDKLQGGGTSIPQLTQALDNAVNGRDLLAWSSIPAVEKDWTAAGAGGRLPDDGLLLGFDNTGGSKLDPYLNIHVQLTEQVEGRDTVVTVRADVANRTPDGLPPYVNGTAAGTTPNLYQGVASLDLPRYAGDVTVRGGSLLAHGADGPSNVVAVAVRIPQGGSAEVTWSFRLPGHHGTLSVQPSARAPTISWTASDGTFTDDTAHPVSW